MVEQLILGVALFVCGFIVGQRIERRIILFSLQREGIELVDKGEAE
jgi:hypothetical protein|tara:strand:+ start:108 stop:245 length:138 start_codon:yes stop_codon:yes gene_type:complete